MEGYHKDMNCPKIFSVSLGILFLLLGMTCSVRSEEAITPFSDSLFWKRGNLRLHYQVWFPHEMYRGKVLLVHGFGSSTFSWRYAKEFLPRAGYLVVAVDLPGFGYSSRIRGFDHSQQNRGRLLWEFLDALNAELGLPLCEKPWHLVGHSMGGQIVFFMGMDHPEKTGSIVLVDTPFRTSSPRFFRLLSSCSLAKGFLATFLRRSFLKPSRVRRFLASAYGRKPTQEEVEGYFMPLKIKGTAQVLFDLSKAPPTSLSQFQGKTHPPLFIIWGSKDLLVPVKQARKLTAAFPKALLYFIEGAAHCPMETHPDEFYPLLIHLLGR